MNHNDDPANAERDVEDKPLHVSQTQKLTERQNFKCKSEQPKFDRLNRHPTGANLYVQNLDDTINDERLSKVFSRFGKITSAKVMLEEGRSRGFGFVCFSTPTEATNARTEMNGYILHGKPLYVALAQVKNERKALIESEHFVKRFSDNRMKQVPTDHKQQVADRPTHDYNKPTPYEPERGPTQLAQEKNDRKAPSEYKYVKHALNSHMKQIPNDQNSQSADTPVPKKLSLPLLVQGPAQTVQVRALTRRPCSSQGRPSASADVPKTHVSPHAQPADMRSAQSEGPIRDKQPSKPSIQACHLGALAVSAQDHASTVRKPPQPLPVPQNPHPHPHPQPQPQPQLQPQLQMETLQLQPQPQPQPEPEPQPQPQLESLLQPQLPQELQPQPQLVPHPQQELFFQTQESLSATMLALAPYHIQKEILGAHLYRLIEHMCLELAAKITGMLLEMDNSELVYIIGHAEALNAKVGEAVAVLQAHQAKQATVFNKDP